MNSTKTLFMADGQVASEEILNKPAEQFERFQREEKIHDVEFKTEAVSYIKDVWRSFKRDKVTVVAAIALLFIVIMAIVGPNISKYDYLEQHMELRYMPPRVQFLEDFGILDGTRVLTVQEANLAEYEGHIVEDLGEVETQSAFGNTVLKKIRVDMYSYLGVEDMYFWFGADALGRDLFSRLWQGTRVSLLMALAVVSINLSVGLVIGSICGYYGGWVDLIVQRIQDVIWNIPSLPLTIMLIMLFGSGLLPLVLVFCLTGWMGTANSVRMQFYRYKNREYVLAARTMGASDIKIMFRHILPNAAGTIITSCALSVPSVVFQEAGLSYLGLGIQAPNPSIGMLLSDGQKVLMDYPYVILTPGIVIVILMLAFNLLGNGLRDAFNPTARQ